MKKAGLLFATVIMMVILFAFSASALSETGQCGDNVYWNYDSSTGEVVISGSGPMYDYEDYIYSPFYNHRSSIKKVVIKDGVTSIGDYAFYACKTLTIVTISDSVTRIGKNALSYCDNINSITVGENNTNYSSDSCGVLFNKEKTILFKYPSGNKRTSYEIPNWVTSIDDYAFYYSKSLTSIIIPNTVASIGDYGFYKCEELKSIIIPDSVTDIGEIAFGGCENLESVVIGAGVTTIENRTFDSCYSLKDVSIPDGITTISSWTFHRCDSLEYITIPNSVTVIEEYAFYGCGSLKNIVIPDSVTTLGNAVFYECSALESVTIGSGIKIITDATFDSCYSLINIFIPNNVTAIGLRAFAYCSSLESVVIGNSVTDIDNRAFDYCNSLESIIIPNSVMTIGADAFCNAKNLKNVYYQGTEEQWKSITISYGNTPLTSASIHYNSPGVIPEHKEYTISGRTFTKNLDYFTSYTNSSSYNTELANIAAALSKDVYSKKKIKADYTALGFEEENVAVNDYDGDFNPDTCGYTVGFKKSEYSDEAICLITVRGSSNTSDWVGNISMLTLLDGKHIGFSFPANRIYDAARKMAKDKGFTGKMKYVLTGHSRGAAVANLLAVKLMEDGVSSSDVYNYNFACPDVAALFSFKSYNNIFNICNRLDIVPYVPGDIASAIAAPGISWDKYGKTYWFTSYNDDRSPLVPEHDMGLYLEHLDKKLLPSEWEQTSGDKFHDIVADIHGWTAKVFCPVDVVVTDSQGNRLASVIGSEVNYYNSNFGDVIIFTDGDKKIIYIKGDKEFKVNLTGTDDGTMMYSLEKCNPITQETFESKVFTDVELKKGKEMQSSVGQEQKAEDVKLFVTEKQSGEEINSYEISENGAEKEINHVYKAETVKAECIKDGKVTYTCSCGDTYTETLPAAGHTDKDKNYICDICGVSAGSAPSVPSPVPHTHSHKVTSRLSATYTQVEKTVYTCSCGDSYTVTGKSVLKLKKPTSLKTKAVKVASKNKSTLTVAWNKVDGAEKYEVERYVGKKWKKVKTVSGTSLKISKLTAGKSYKFRVRAVVGANKSAWSTYTAKVVPLKPTLTLKSGKKQLTANWKSVANITGYEVQYSTSKKFAKKTAKTVTVKKAKTKKTVIKKLRKGKKYFVRIRAYKTVGNKKIYGAWSTVRNVKVK